VQLSTETQQFETNSYRVSSKQPQPGLQTGQLGQCENTKSKGFSCSARCPDNHRWALMLVRVSFMPLQRSHDSGRSAPRQASKALVCACTGTTMERESATQLTMPLCLHSETHQPALRERDVQHDVSNRWTCSYWVLLVAVYQRWSCRGLTGYRKYSAQGRCNK
jgi:hypothetical protein